MSIYLHINRKSIAYAIKSNTQTNNSSLNDMFTESDIPTDVW